MSGDVQIIGDAPGSLPIQVTTDCALLVQGIENWITGLVPMGELEIGNEIFLRLCDANTNAVFLVRREK